MPVPKTIQQEIDQNPEIRMVLEIATRVRESEARELPRELVSSSEVVAIPAHAQYGC